jgi:hypothetical protein
MKKILVLVFVIATFGYISCDKSETADAPVASFTASVLDSSKVAGLSQISIDSLIKANAPGYFIDIVDGTPVKAYKKMVIFRYGGSSTKFRALYTGDSSHIYVDPSNPGNVTTAQSGVDFPNDYLVYTYKVLGTYPSTVVSTNVSSTGKDVKRAVATKTLVLQ